MDDGANVPDQAGRRGKRRPRPGPAPPAQDAAALSAAPAFPISVPWLLERVDRLSRQHGGGSSTAAAAAASGMRCLDYRHGVAADRADGALAHVPPSSTADGGGGGGACYAAALPALQRDHLLLAPFLAQLLLSTPRMLLLTGAGCKRALLAAIARALAAAGPGVEVAEVAIHERDYRASMGAILERFAATGAPKAAQSAAAAAAAAGGAGGGGGGGGGGGRRKLRSGDGAAAAAGAAPAPPAPPRSSILAAASLTSSACGSGVSAAAAAAADALDRAVRRDAAAAARPVRVLVVHGLDRVFLRDAGAAAALLRPLPPGTRILASLDNAAVVLHALDERHRIALNLLVYEAPTYALEAEGSGGGGGGGGGGGAVAGRKRAREERSAAAAAAAGSESSGGDATDDSAAAAAAAAGAAIGASSREGVDKAVRSLPPVMQHLLRLLLSLAEAGSGVLPAAGAASATAAATAALLRVDPLALFEEASSRLLVSTEHALAKALHELSDANLVALHADGGISIGVHAGHLKDSLRAALRGTR